MNEEEEIIKNGLKSHSKQDTLCYIGIGVLAILIFIPPIFRVIFASSIPKSTIEEVTYMSVSCKTAFFDDDGKIVSEIIESNYRQGEILDMKVQFLYDNPSPKFAEIQLKDFEELSKKHKEFSMKKEKQKVTFSIDFLEHLDLKKNADFKDYTKLAPAQMNYYEREVSPKLSCDNEAETKQEDTKKWNKEHGIEVDE
jgi:hypothetical protein